MTRKKRPIWVCDSETDPFLYRRIPKPFLWGLYDGKEFHSFTDTDEFVEFIIDKNVILYAHNGGKFDFHFILDYVNKYEPIKIINGRIASAMVGDCELRDSICILPVGLGSYKKDEIDYDIFEANIRDEPGNMDKIVSYLRGDCVYLHELVTRFCDEYGVNLTLAGAAMRFWKRKFNGVIPTCANEEGFYNEFSKFYFGGRVECFKVGIFEGNFSCFDVNSSYPTAMLSPHPISKTYITQSGFASGADFYEVECISDGAFPLRAENGGLFFPRDTERRRYYVTRWEHDAALEIGLIGDITYINSVLFDEHVEFGAYVNYFYALRKVYQASEDKGGDLIAKLFLNALYGKFAANPDNYLEYMAFEQSDAPYLLGGNEYTLCSEFGLNGLLGAKPLSEDAVRFYNVATAASITGFSRALLMRGLAATDKPIYCDTDSIICEGDSRLEVGGNLGQWKKVGDYTRGGVAGKKLYIFEGYGKTIKASKGARLSDNELWEVCSGKTVKYYNQAPSFSVRRKRKPTESEELDRLFISRDIKITKNS